ncbi:MAG: hypothetical protein DDT19_00538 [Syntrophomonadaceae bacterium]|nr:hypothetical protein [Bacillota bacterium]
MFRVAGIDTGVSGAICIAQKDSDGQIKFLSIGDIPTLKVGKGKRIIDEQGIKALFSGFGVNFVVIEKALTMPRQGLVSTGKFFESYGILKGICVGMGIPYTSVHPATWKKKMLPFSKKEGKSASLIYMKSQYPSEFGAKEKSHNITDAAVMAIYKLQGHI